MKYNFSVTIGKKLHVYASNKIRRLSFYLKKYVGEFEVVKINKNYFVICLNGIK